METTNLATAYNGSHYTIVGAGGDLQEWVEGYNKLLADEGIGVPVSWAFTTGSEVNRYAESAGYVADQSRFPDDLTLLTFPLDGLNVAKLALFRLCMQDRWFDDLIDNLAQAGN